MQSQLAERIEIVGSIVIENLRKHGPINEAGDAIKYGRELSLPEGISAADLDAAIGSLKDKRMVIAPLVGMTNGKRYLFLKLAEHV